MVVYKLGSKILELYNIIYLLIIVLNNTLQEHLDKKMIITYYKSIE